jgi:CheY-like chemotaxis protein
MEMSASETLSRHGDVPRAVGAAAQGIVIVVSDDPGTIQNLAPVCAFLELRMEVVPSGMDLVQALRTHRPMAAICDVDGQDHDGFHAMKLIARYRRDLPVMLLTNGDAMLMGAADAVQELWGLSSVTRTSGFPMAGQIVGFLFGAGRWAGSMRLVPI